MKHMKRLPILVALVLAVGLWTVTGWAQREGGDVSAETASALDECALGVAYYLVPEPGHPYYNEGDAVKHRLWIDSDGRLATRIEVTVSYAGTDLTYVGVDTAGYPRPWGDDPWIIFHDAGAKTISTIVNIGAGAAALNGYLLEYQFTYGCKAPGENDSLVFFESCSDVGLTSTANSIDADGYHIGAGSTHDIILFSGDPSNSYIAFDAAESGPNAPISVPIILVTSRTNTGGFSFDLAFDETKLQFTDIDPTGTITFGTDVSATLVEAPGAPDTVKITCTDGLGSHPGGDWLIYVNFTNLMPAHLQFTTINAVNVTLVDCYGEYPAPDKFGTPTTVFRATMSVADVTLTKSTSGSARVSLTTNFDVHMNTEAGRAIFNLNENALALVTIDGAADLLLDDYNFEEHTEPSGDWMVWELAGPNNSSTIPASATPYELFDVNLTAGSRCGSSVLTFQAGTQLSWAQDDNVIITYPYITFDGGTVTVNGCPPQPPNPSCPFVSVWDGAGFVDENTILTQSEFSAEGMAVVDHYMLSARPALQDGMYRVRIEEREDETTYLDEIKLVVAEGQPGRPVEVTPEGKFFYPEMSLAPSAAVNDQGEDILAQVTGVDGDYYTSLDPGWLTVTYEIPETRSGTVLFAQATGEKQICGVIHKMGDGDGIPMDLRISYRENGGSWVTLPPGPPRDMVAREFRATDLQFRAGSVIDVKYEWAGSWATDDLSLTLAANDVPQVTTLTPTATFHNAMGKVTSTLDRADNEFTVLNKGEYVELQFPAGRRPDASAETHFVIAAKGYYLPYAQSNGLMVPNDYALHPNYPNPFNAQTNVSFAMAHEGRVDIVVFNVLGQTVKTLASETYPAGEHTINWDGTNDQGLPVASGTYFIRMKTGDFEQQRKMTLLK